MENKLWLEQQIDLLKDNPVFKLEEFKLSVTEQLCRIMDEKSMSRKELAQKLQCSSAYITKMLNGGENLTLSKLFQIATALDSKLEIDFIPNGYYTLKHFKPYTSGSTTVRNITSQSNSGMQNLQVFEKFSVDFIKTDVA